MKIAELASRTEVSKQLIHHYIREGLVKKPAKTGPNSAEYDEGHVEQILLIKNLRDKYFLPLPLIKKIVARQKKQPQAERMLFNLQSQHLQPIDRFFPHAVRGREEYRRLTGLGPGWLAKFEEWGVITPRLEDGEAVFPQEEVDIGRLIFGMDQLGFGPKDGYDPGFLKQIADLLRSTLAISTRKYLAKNIDKLDSEEFKQADRGYSEALSLFVYLIFKKIMLEESARVVEELGQRP